MKFHRKKKNTFSVLTQRKTGKYNHRSEADIFCTITLFKKFKKQAMNGLEKLNVLGNIWY